MSSEAFAIRVTDVTKRYMMYARPEDRLKQSVVPRLERLIGRPPTKFYKDFDALHGVSFEVGRGETVGIIGRNGSGKSTLLQVICGTLTPTSGTVEVRGRIAALLELGAGFNPEFSGRENVYMNAAILGLSREETDSRFEAITKFADIGDFLEHPVKTYSSGMFVRLAFAVAINVDPDILVVDEALSVGDEAFQRKCFARIEQIKDRGATILFVSHGAQTIVQLCDRAILMDGGEKLLDGPPKPVVSQYQRLVNANAPDQATIRAELKAIVFEFNETESLTAGTLQVEAKQEAVSARHLTLLPASFNPDLKSESVVEYEKNGACIFEMAIFDRHRNPVNLLVHTEEYEMTYKVRFDRNVEFVGFGMMIRTATGIDVMGQGSHWLGRGASAKAGQTIEVRFPFSCQLLPGTYFINAGVSEHYNISYELLHRILDGIMFKVLPCDFPRPIVGLFNAVGGRIAVDDVLIELVGGD